MIMTNSKLVKQQIIEHYRVDPAKITVIYNGVDMTRFHPGMKIKNAENLRLQYGIKDVELALLFIANDFKLKKLKTVLEAMALLKRQTIRLLVVGNDEAKAYRQWAAKRGMEQQVLFLGSQENIEMFYRAADVFVLPTLYDAFANVCLEAMACGLPVITTQSNGAAELITNGVEGYVLERNDPRELAEKIAILEPDVERSRMGQKAAQKAGRFSWNQHLYQVLRLYELIANQ
jgi:UDP-glucose:(heptosyl)LPS alpha-1,3-glucosyltransferase